MFKALPDQTEPMIQFDPRFSGCIYVVEDDHVILYAGQSYAMAARAVRGSRSIEVWLNDKWMGSVRMNGEWDFMTVHARQRVV